MDGGEDLKNYLEKLEDYILLQLSVLVYFCLPREGLRVYRVVFDNILFMLVLFRRSSFLDLFDV